MSHDRQLTDYEVDLDQVRTLGELSDLLFNAFLHEYVKPGTYGEEWVLTGSRNQVLASCAWMERLRGGDYRPREWFEDNSVAPYSASRLQAHVGREEVDSVRSESVGVLLSTASLREFFLRTAKAVGLAKKEPASHLDIQRGRYSELVLEDWIGIKRPGMSVVKIISSEEDLYERMYGDPRGRR